MVNSIGRLYAVNSHKYRARDILGQVLINQGICSKGAIPVAGKSARIACLKKVIAIFWSYREILEYKALVVPLVDQSDAFLKAGHTDRPIGYIVYPFVPGADFGIKESVYYGPETPPRVSAIVIRNYIVLAYVAGILVAESNQSVVEFLGGLWQGKPEFIKPVLADKNVC